MRFVKGAAEVALSDCSGSVRVEKGGPWGQCSEERGEAFVLTSDGQSSGGVRWSCDTWCHVHVMHAQDDAQGHAALRFYYTPRGFWEEESCIWSGQEQPSIDTMTRGLSH